MLLDKFERNKRKFIYLEKRRSEILDILSKRTPIPLKEPYQDGWIISWKIKKDIDKRRDYKNILKIFNLCFSYKRKIKKASYISFIRKGYKNINLKGKYIDFSPGIKRLSEKEFNDLPNELKNFFIKEKNQYFSGYSYRIYNFNFVELKVTKNIVTHYFEKGGDLEKELSFITKILYSVENPFFINYGKSFPAHKDRTSIRSQIQKFKKGEIEDIDIQKIPLEYVY